MKKKISGLLLLVGVVVIGYLILSNGEAQKITNHKGYSDDAKSRKNTYNKNSNKEKAIMANNYVFPTKEPVRAIPSGHKFLVRVKINKQQVIVYEDSVKVRTMECSTGLVGKDSSTPLGHFKINGYFGQSFYNNKYNEGARYWVGFINGKYLFHSIPTEEDGEAIAAEAQKIGNRASHGCVRLSIKDAYWFYETVPQGANVVIEK